MKYNHLKNRKIDKKSADFADFPESLDGEIYIDGDIETFILTSKDVQSVTATNNDYVEYLKNTDWYVIREIETGKKMPADIKANRETARGMIK